MRCVILWGPQTFGMKSHHWARHSLSYKTLLSLSLFPYPSCLIKWTHTWKPTKWRPPSRPAHVINLNLSQPASTGNNLSRRTNTHQSSSSTWALAHSPDSRKQDLSVSLSICPVSQLLLLMFLKSHSYPKFLWKESLLLVRYCSLVSMDWFPLNKKHQTHY